MRLFISFKIPDPIREKIKDIQKDLRLEGFPARWDEDEKIHLTLVFLGDVEEENLDQLEKLTSDVTQRYHPINLHLLKFGSFGNRGKIPVWIGLGGELEEIFLLQRELHVRAAEIIQLHGREDYVPHIRIAKFFKKRKNKGQLERLDLLWKRDYVQIQSAFDTVELIHSIPHEGYHEHKTLRSFRLSA